MARFECPDNQGAYFAMMRAEHASNGSFTTDMEGGICDFLGASMRRPSELRVFFLTEERGDFLGDGSYCLKIVSCAYPGHFRFEKRHCEHAGDFPSH